MSPLLIGAMFVVSGGCYGFSAPIWGMICDKKPPKAVTLVGAITISAGFALLGPLPFFHLDKTIGVIIAGLVLHGLGLGAEVVAGFADAHKSVSFPEEGTVNPEGYM